MRRSQRERAIREAPELLRLSREADGDAFLGAVVHLGALGVITQMTLAIEPTFTVQQDVYIDLPVEQLEANYEAIESDAYSVSLFTNWQGTSVGEIWLIRPLYVRGLPSVRTSTFMPGEMRERSRAPT